MSIRRSIRRRCRARRLLLVLLAAVVFGLWLASAASAGPKIAFTVADSTRRSDGIWTVAADGSGSRQLTSGPAYDLAPAWSPGRGSIAFIRSESGDVYDRKAWVMVMRSDGTNQRRLTYSGPSLTSGSYALAYSPDGRYLAGGTSLKAGPEYGSDYGVFWGITVLDLRTRQSRVVYRYRCENGIQSLSWSGDGSQLVATVEYGGGYGMFRVDVAGARLLNDYEGTTSRVWASWRPDGKYLLVAGYPAQSPGATLSVLLMRPDGTTVKTIAKRQGCPVYSPDGEHYAFVVGQEIKYADGDGKHPRRVLDFGEGRYASYLAWR